VKMALALQGVRSIQRGREATWPCAHPSSSGMDVSDLCMFQSQVYLKRKNSARVEPNSEATPLSVAPALPHISRVGLRYPAGVHAQRG
jgi:hypothetical protein